MGEILKQPASIRLLFLILFLFLATAGLWIRPTLFGVDSYSTLSFVRYGWAETLTNQPFANFFFALIPDSMILIKLIMFLSIVAAVIPIWLLVREFYDERAAWISIFFLMTLSPIVLFGFGEFENEIFAYPLIAWGIYLFMTKKYWGAVTAITGATLFWKWLYYFTFFNESSSRIVEMQMFSGLINAWALIPFLFFIPLLKKGRAAVFGIIAIIFWLINAKLFIFLIPFVALAIPKGLDLLQKYPTIKYPTIKFSLYIFAFCGLIGWNIAFFMQQPTQNDIVFVSESIQLARDTNLPLYNDPSFGYWIMAQGIKTPYNPGSSEEFPSTYPPSPGIYLTEKFMPLPCELIKTQKDIGRTKRNIFQCN
jgi:hypothetical protein